MVTQTATASDSPIISDSITKEAIGGSGNVGLGITDSPTFTDILAESNILPTVAIDPTFAHLNGRTIFRGSVTRSTIKEKLAICTVTFPSNVTYKTGGMLVDFTSIGAIQRFSTVYLVSIQNKTNAFYTNFVADTNNSPKLGKIKFYDNTGTEIANGALSIQNIVLQCVVRGA